jgi:hypothetical protein
MMPAVMVANRRLYRYNARSSVRMRTRIAELKRLWPSIPDSDEGRFRIAIMLYLLAQFDDGPARMDQFLAASAPWMSPQERTQKKEAALVSNKTYKAKEIGQLIGLTWAMRTKHRITTIDAIDAPSIEVRDEMEKVKRAAYMRECRRMKPKPPRAGQRKAAELARRRLEAIVAALPLDEWMPVTELCEQLKKAKHNPFSSVAPKSLPTIVRRLIKDDNAGLQTELRSIPDRPDLKSAMWVTREAPPTDQRKPQPPAPAGGAPEARPVTREPSPTTTKETNMAMTIKTKDLLPTTEAEYRAHVAARLADFTPATARDELPGWFNSSAEKALRAACGISDHREFLRIANARRNELLAQRDREMV